MKLRNKSIGYILLVINIIAILLGVSIVSYTAIMQVSGLAVASTPYKWNNVKDGGAGDNLTDGTLASQMYIYDGTNFDRVTGDTTNGVDVDITRMNDGGNTISVDDGGSTISIDDGGGSITIDGTVTTTPSGVQDINTATSSTITTGQVTVSTSATLIIAANSSRRSVVVRNTGSTDMYIGASGVTTATGFLVKASEAFTVDRSTAAIYGVVASGTTTTNYIEE